MAYLHTGRPWRPGSGKRCHERPTKARMARPVGTRVLGTCAQEARGRPGLGCQAVRLWSSGSLLITRINAQRMGEHTQNAPGEQQRTPQRLRKSPHPDSPGMGAAPPTPEVTANRESPYPSYTTVLIANPLTRTRFPSFLRRQSSGVLSEARGDPAERRGSRGSLGQASPPRPAGAETLG